MCKHSLQRLASNCDSDSSGGMNSFAITTAMGSMILTMTLCARMLTFIHVFGKASFSRIDVATLKNWPSKATNLSRPSISRLDSKNVVICFVGDDSMRTRNTMAVSPKLGYSVESPSFGYGVLLTPRGGSGKEATRENGYDSGKVTGIGALVVDGLFVRSMAFFDAGFWISR